MSLFQLSPLLIERLGWTLLHSLWQFPLIALLAGAAVRLLVRNSSATRHGVLGIALVATVIAPAITWALLPAAFVETSDNSSESTLLSTVIAEQAANSSSGSKADNFPMENLEVSAANRSVDVPLGISQTMPAENRPIESFGWDRLTTLLRPWLSWIVAGWCVGVLLCSLRPLLGWHMLRRLRRVGVSPVSDEVLDSLQRVSERLRMRRAVRILHSTLAKVPVVVGYFRPVILLPLSLATTIPAVQLETILAHELAHVRRHDFLVNLLQTLVETVFFYHPAIWWLSNRLRAERENCCDDLVIAALGNRVEYGRALLAVEELRGRKTILAVGAADGSLLTRVRRILGFPTRQTSPSPWSALSLVVCGLIVACTMSLFSWHSLAGLPQVEHGSEETRSEYEGRIESVGENVITFDDGRVITTDAATKYLRLSDSGVQPAERKEFQAGLRVRYELAPGHAATKLMIRSGQDDEKQNAPHQGAAREDRPSVNAHLESFASAPSDWQQLEVAQKIIALGDPSVIPNINPYLLSEDRRTRCHAGLILARLGDPRGRTALINELQDATPRPTDLVRSDGQPHLEGQIASDRYYAAQLLGQLGDKAAVPALIEATKEKSINDVAAISLGELGDPRAIPALRQMLVDFPSERLWAGYGLAALGESEGFKILTDMTKDPVWTERRHAVEALGKIGDRMMVPVLIQAIQDEHVNVRVSAVRSLGKIGDPAALPALGNALHDTEATEVNAPTTVASEAQKAINAIQAKQAKEPAKHVPAQNEPATVVGTVITPDGKPVAGIEVLAFQGGKQLEQKFQTDERGEFRVPKEWREAEQWLTVVARDGRERLGWFDFMVHGHSDTGQKSKEGSFRLVLLPMSRTVRGRLRDESGQPLAQIPVRIHQLNHDVNLFSVHWRYQKLNDEPLVLGAVTDPEGRFELKLPADSFAWLGTSHPDWVEQQIRVTKDKEEVGDTKLVRAAKVAGRVLDSRTGKPVVGVRIGARAAQTELFESSGDDALTDAKGDYVIQGLRSGEFTIQGLEGAEKTLTAPAIASVQLKPNETFRADFALFVGKRLAGRVLDMDTGEPIPNCKVTYTGPARPLSDGLSTETNAQGEFEFFVPPGESRLDATEGRRFGAESTRDIPVPADGDPEPVILKVGEKTEVVPGSFKIFLGPPLDRKVSAHFQRAPLAEVLEHLCQSAGVKLELDVDGLKREGYTKNMAVSINAESMTLQEALTDVLKTFEKLSFMLDQNQIFISTRSEVEARENANAQAGKSRVNDE